MKISCEISNPHYHPGPHFDMPLTKKRDLSVPPYWVANERIQKDGISFAIVMPRREKELFEIYQAPHIHLPKSLGIKEIVKRGTVNGTEFLFRIKHEPSEFKPTAHFDSNDAGIYGIKAGDIVLIDFARTHI